MNFLTSIQNFMQFINNNWTSIVIIIGLVLSVAKKITDYAKKSKEEKIEIAKQQIKETMLKLVTDAEEDYLEWISAGDIKRSQVIDEIFKKYPALSKVANQEEVVNWIDDTIDEALKTMREIFEKQPVYTIETTSESISEENNCVKTDGYIQI